MAAAPCCSAPSCSRTGTSLFPRCRSPSQLLLESRPPAHTSTTRSCASSSKSFGVCGGTSCRTPRAHRPTGGVRSCCDGECWWCFGGGMNSKVAAVAAVAAGCSCCSCAEYCSCCSSSGWSWCTRTRTRLPSVSRTSSCTAARRRRGRRSRSCRRTSPTGPARGRPAGPALPEHTSSLSLLAAPTMAPNHVAETECGNLQRG